MCVKKVTYLWHSNLSNIQDYGTRNGSHVFIADHNHAYENPHVPVSKQGVRCNPTDEVIIGEGSWLGTNVVIVGNVHYISASIV